MNSNSWQSIFDKLGDKFDDYINDSIILTIAPITLLVILELLLAYISIKSRRFRGK